MRQRFLRILLVCSIVSGLVATNMPLAVDAADPGSVLHLGQLGTTLQPGRVNFRLAAVRAKVACASLKGRVLDSLSTITGAADVPAGNGAPAHCEIVVSAKNTLHIAID